MKVFRILTYTGLNGVEQIVAASSQKKAAAAFNVSVGYLREWGGTIVNQNDVETAIASPGTVFERPHGYGPRRAPWRKRG